MAATIASDLHLDKSSTYRAVTSLVNQGLLVSYPRKRGSTYKAAPPDILKEKLAQRMRMLAKQQESIQSVIDELKKQAHTLKRNTYITVEKGWDAYFTMMTNSLSCKELCIREKFAFSSQIPVPKPITYWKEYINKRVKNRIRIKQLYDRPSMTKGSEVMIPSEKDLKEIRILPPDVEDRNYFRVYDDTVVIISRDETEDFIVITLKDIFVANLMKNLFDFIWTRSETYIPRMK